MLAASEVGAAIDARSLPVLPRAGAYSESGVSTGGAKKTRAYLEPHLALDPDLSQALQGVLCDPQTSGGLLIAVAPEKTARLLDALEREGVAVRAVVGRVTDRPRELRVLA
jgi:selenide,water dikinase